MNEHQQQVHQVLTHLHYQLSGLGACAIGDVAGSAALYNPWFSNGMAEHALATWAEALAPEKTEAWLSAYALPATKMETIGLVMAGNIPGVGLHDLFCVLAAGHKAQVKLSSQDSVIPKQVWSLILEVMPGWAHRVEFVEKLQGYDRVIATGSDNTSRYFRAYFKHVPHIIRHNRTSIAILDGTESPEELAALGEDLYRYFGLGCRNVSKIYVPRGYTPNALLDALEPWAWIGNHTKWANNYEYQRAALLVNQIPHWDTGYALFREDAALVSPLGVTYLEAYDSVLDLEGRIQPHYEKIQCVVSRQGWWPESLPLGTAQHPGLFDYADGVDTLKFLLD